MDEVRRRDDSSDSSLSPVPSPRANGPHSLLSDTIIVAPHSQSSSSRVSAGVALGSAAAASHNAKNTTTPSTDKVKKPRKKKDPDAAGKPKADDKPPKEKKPRKPRTSNPDGSASSRKKQKIAETPAATSASAHATSQANTPTLASALAANPAVTAPPRQPNLSQDMNRYLVPQKTPETPQHQQVPTNNQSIFKSESLAPAQTPMASRPASSGQRYDPIRGMNIEDPQPIRTPPVPQSPSIQRAAPSPTVASLMNPPAASQILSHSSIPKSAASSPRPPQAVASVASSPAFPTANRTADGQLTTNASNMATQHKPQPSVVALDGAMEIDIVEHPKLDASTPKAIEDKSASKPASLTATPKNHRPSPPSKRAPPPGSGLLSSSDLFGGASSSDDQGPRHGVNIEIEISLNPAGGNVINMAQEIMKKYGAEALNPRAAAHRQHLLQVAAAANKLEQGSGDEMSVDGSDGENDSNVEMGGMDGDKSMADGEQPKKRRKRKTEDYDKEDDFIDDTELAWEESAAVAKDGFFVYSGALVPEDKTQGENTAPSGRGRGRGRGRARGAAAGLTHATLAAKTENGSSSAAATGRGRGRGRGTGAPRKPRITKADRERLEFEKAQREQTAGLMGAKQMLSAPTPTLNTT